MASIPDSGTNDFLQNLIQDADIWIGAFLNSTWTWSDETPWDYTNWHENEPNNGGGIQTHVAFNIDSSGQWDDEYKGNEKTFICHYKGKNKIHKIGLYLNIHCYLQLVHLDGPPMAILAGAINTSLPESHGMKLTATARLLLLMERMEHWPQLGTISPTTSFQH